jgi:S1-C subfamily serine protease
MIAPTGRLKAKKRPFYEIVHDMRHVVCSIVRQRQVPGGMGARALGTGFFVSREIFITCEHVVNDPSDPHQNGDSYLLVRNLGGTSGAVFPIANPQLGKEITLFPNLDLAVLRVATAPHDQPFVPLEYGYVYEGEDIGVVGYPLAEIRAVNGNIAFDAVLYRAARGCVTGRYIASQDGQLANVPYIEVNFLFVPGNSGGPVFSAETGRVVGYVRGFRAVKIKESLATASPQAIPQLPLGMSSQYIEGLHAIYSVAIKLDFIRTTVEGFGVSL